jgi:hypothetical protein
MNELSRLIETYLMVLVHPFRIHQQFRYRLPIPNHEGHLYEPLTLAESLGISWVFAILRGLGRVIVLNFFLHSFLSMHSETFPFLQELLENSGTSSYYFLLFSAALDVIFFPIGAIVMTEVWTWVIRKYAEFLGPELPHSDIADQITAHALSANLFSIIPFIGDLVQFVLYYFLLYAGLRSNLGATRSLAAVILLTPMLFMAMMVSLFLVVIFYLLA